jgi:transcription initiation factor TFIIE subunit alpha
MKTRKRMVRSRVRKPTSRKKVAVARKHTVRVVRKIAIKAFRKAVKKARPVKKKTKARRSAISVKLADEHVRNLILEIAGEKALAVAAALEEPLSDEDLASSCKIKVSEVRAVLNKLHSYGLTSYERTRDKESGWYSYIWRLSFGDLNKILERKKGVAVIGGGEESFDFYTCSSCKKGEGVMIPFEVAFENRFKCLDCGAPLIFVEKAKEMRK